jgi:hypothetical protein
MTNDIDRLLEKGLLEPPPQFTTRVMQRLGPPPRLASRRERLREWFEWLAVAGATLVGFAQLAAFLFVFWIPASAG